MIMIVQLGGLYWLSGQLQQQLAVLLFGWLKTPERTVKALSLLFWPGVLLHELSHLVVGRLLLVKTGGLTIIPKIQSNGTVAMGSVAVPKVDRIRFFLIGIAPVAVGVGTILGLLWLAEAYGWGQRWEWRVVMGYAIFQIANNMFLSKSDLRGALPLFILLVLVLGLLRWLGFELSMEWVGPWLANYETVLAQAQQWLWIPIVIDAVLLAVLLGLRRGFRFGG